MQMIADKAVILAGGKGSRARVKTKYENVLKVMLPIDRKPNLQRNIEILRDQLGIKSFILIVSYKDSVIRNYFNNGASFGIEIEYIKSDPDYGIADALLLTEPKIKGPFFVVLGDEFYLNTNHSVFKDADYKNASAVVAFIRKNSPQEIARNYAVYVDDNMRVSRLLEKPQEIQNDLLGLGTFLLSDSVFEYIKKTGLNKRTGKRELIDVISNMAKDGRVFAQELKGAYININTIDDWHFAQYLANQASFNQKKKSLVIPTYNEVDSVSFVISDFKDTVDEIVVVDGGSTDGTIEKIEEFNDKKIKLIRGKFLGYGDALCHGIDACTGDIITLVEADATFRSRDIYKMYEYIKDSDMVIGTRTTRQLICQGANMPVWLRIGNVLAAKFIELLWINKEPRFTDVGCTYRTFWRSSYDQIKGNFIGTGPEFSPEMLIEFTRNNRRVIEIPVSYYARVGGSSKHSGSFLGVSKTALRMLALVLKKRFIRNGQKNI